MSYGELLDSFEDQRHLIEIGRELMRERDPDRLLRRILEVSRLMTGADAGSIFLAEDFDGVPSLRFKYSETVSLDAPYEEFVMPRTTGSIAGYVSLTGKSLNLADVYALPEGLPFHFNDSFDLAHGYLTRSMLTVPMTDHTGAVVGVIQLINSKERPGTFGIDPDRIFLRTPEDFRDRVVPFKDRYVPLMEAVAAQAAVALENAAMIQRIRTQFEQFALTAVDAVEARDPATSGHSRRVADYAARIAAELDRAAEARGERKLFTESKLQELRYAGLLHDFGKIYVDPAIFSKARKLFPSDRDRLELRHRYLRSSIELAYERDARAEGGEGEAAARARSEALAALEDAARAVDLLDAPSVQAEDPDAVVDRLVASGAALASGIDGEAVPVVTEAEAENLRIRRGSLNARERAEIERHVVSSYEFVKRIPWPPEFSAIPDYVRAHHEMLDGSGYPDGKRGGEIPLQARILAAADVFDALVAADRPYKKSVPREKAFAILREEAARGRLDASCVEALAAAAEEDR